MRKPLSQLLFEFINSDIELMTLLDNRIFPLLAPAKTPYPYVITQKISGSPVNSHDGYSGMDVARYQLTVYSKDQWEVEQVSAALLDRMNGFRVEIDGEDVVILNDNDMDGFDESSRVYSKILDFNVLR